MKILYINSFGGKKTQKHYRSYKQDSGTKPLIH